MKTLLLKKISPAWVVCAVGLAMFVAQPAWAAAGFTWDANTGTTGPQDGAGTWDAGLTANWWNGSADVVWPNTTNTTSIATIGAASGAAGTIAVSGTVTLNQISFAAAGSGNYTLSGGTLSFGGTTPTIKIAAALTPVINSVISEASAGTAMTFSATSIGSGSITLGGANTFTGSPTVSVATVIFNNLANGGTASSFGSGANTVPVIVCNSGSAAAVTYTGGAASTDRPFTVNGVATSGMGINNNGTGAISFNNTGACTGGTAGIRVLLFGGTYTASANTFAELISDMPGFTTTNKVGGNTWTFTGANTHSGGTIMNSAGVINLGNASALGSGPFIIAGNGSFDNTTSGNISVNNVLNLIGGSPIYIGSAHSMAINGAVSLNANRTVTVTANTLTLGGQITGAFTLTKAGNGTLVLNNSGTADTHSGTLISAGTLDLGATTQSLGAVTFSGSAATQNGTVTGTGYTSTVTSTSPGVATVSANLAGVGAALSHTGAGILALLGANTFSGGTTIGGSGTIVITNDAGLGASGGAVLFSASGTLATTNYGAAASNNVTVSSARTITVNSPLAASFTTLDTNNLTIAAKITGAGGVVKKSSSFALGTVRFSNDTSDYTGDFGTGFGNTEFTSVADQGTPSSLGAGASGTGGVITITNATSSGTLRYVGASNSVTHRLLNWGGTTATYTLDASGTGTVQYLATGNLRSAATGSAEFRLRGTNTGSNTLAEVINDSGSGVTSLTKFDPGTWVLTAANTFSGGITNSGGTLLINGSVGGAGMTNAGGAVGGTGAINCAVAVQAGGTLQPGPGSGVIGTLTINSNLSLAGTASMIINRANAQTASEVSGVLALNYGGTLSVSNSGPTLVAGDTFTLFSAASYSGSFATESLPALGAGLVWDTSQLPVNGTIFVAALPAVTVSPAATNLVFGNSVTLTANATGDAPLTYQWYSPTATAIPSATGSTLTFSPTVAQGGIYSVVVSNNYGTATNSATVTVSAAGTALALGSSANPALPGASVTFTATISVVAPGAGTPPGGVQFLTNGAAAGAVVPFTGNIAQLSLSTLPHATNLITAQYAGDANFSASSNNLNQIINTPPVAGPANYSRPRDIPLHIKVSDLLTNATDPDGDALALFSFSTNSTNGAIIAAVSTNGTFISYTPPATNGNVTDTFTYVVADTFGATNAGTVTISILPDDNGPTVNITGLTNAPDGTAIISFAGIPGRSYLVQATTNLTPTIVWTTLSTNSAGTNGLFQYDDLDSTNYPIRYYRTAQP